MASAHFYYVTIVTVSAPGGKGIVNGNSSLCAHSLVHPGEQFVFGNDHPLPDGDGGKVFGVHQRICIGTGDTEHGGYVIGVQRQRELIVRSVSSCHSVSFQILRKLEIRKIVRVEVASCARR